MTDTPLEPGRLTESVTDSVATSAAAGDTTTDSAAKGGRDPRRCMVANCTGDELVVTRGDRVLRLPPLGQLVLDEQVVDDLSLRTLEANGVVRLSREEERGRRGGDLGETILGFTVWVAAGYFVIGGAFLGNQPSWIRFAWWFGVPVVALIGLVVALAQNRGRLGEVAHVGSLLGVLLLGAGVPIGAEVAFGDVGVLLAAGPSAALFGRLAQTLLIVVATMLPVLLYYLFDRQRVVTLRRQFEQHILRLDPRVRQLDDIWAKYSDVIEEAFGRLGSQSSRMIRGNRAPIFVATIAIALGWLLTLPVTYTPSLGDPADISLFFVPQPRSYVFGFLGAYFFAISAIVRRYVRGDLRPKAYGMIAVRILSVFVLCWVLDVTFGSKDWVLVAAFLIGVVPETFFTLLTDFRRAAIGKIAKSLRETHPLTNLEGIDLYDRSRLLDEGVGNIEALAHHDLVDLMLATRIPVPRIVDWVDQAILYLHTVTADGEDAGDHGERRRQLRSLGIRTATDLEICYTKHRAQLWSTLDPQRAKTDGTLSPYQVMHSAIADDEWMPNIRAWRLNAPPSVRRFAVDAAGTIVT